MKTNERYKFICQSLIEYTKSIRNYFRNFDPKSGKSQNIDLSKIDFNNINKDKNE